MCIVCYLSTDRVIEDIPFNENDRKFNIQRTEERSIHLTKQFVYYCGSSQSCGCGFGRMHITEDILLKTEQELREGELSNETALLWWDQAEPPPKDKSDFDEIAKEIRESHQDTLALYHLIEETRQAGFDCELLVCYSGSENDEIDVMDEVHQDVDFKAAWDEVLLYHFVKS